MQPSSPKVGLTRATMRWKRVTVVPNRKNERAKQKLTPGERRPVTSNRESRMAGGRKDGGNCLPNALKAHPPEVLSARSRSILQIHETRTKQSRNRTSYGAFPAGTQSALAIEGGTNRARDLVLRDAELNTKPVRMRKRNIQMRRTDM